MSTSTTEHGHHHHGFVPPYVQDEVTTNLEEDTPSSDSEALAEQERSARAKAVEDATPSAAPPASGTGRREVYDCQETTTKRLVPVRAEGEPETDDVDVTTAYNYAGIVREFFAEVLNRSSIDNRSLDLILNVHYGQRYNNAFWDGDEMTFGDGDGIIFSGFARSLDVVAHELAHGVTQFTSGLIYADESGALNEHFSDVFGTAITQWADDETPEDADWLIGDEIMGPDLYGEALRSMRHPGTAYDNPIMGRDPQPAHYDDRYTGSADNGGVHINSGIPNRAYYLASTEMGSTIATARIWYHALQFLDPDATFVDAADQIATSARILVKAGMVPKGSAQIVRGAWRAVGVG